MSGANSSIVELLRKTTHYDKDERWMATSDLCEILKRNASNASQSKVSTSTISGYHTGYVHRSQTIDPNTEKRICSAVLKLLDDSSNDVQAIAVKTIGVLVTTVQKDQVLGFSDGMISLILDGSKSALRDVCVIGLRKLIKDAPLHIGDQLSQRLVCKLLDGINGGSSVAQDQKKTADEITLACLDLLTDLLTRFGAFSYMTHEHAKILKVTVFQLASDNHIIQKRTGNTIGCLSAVVSDHLLYRLVENLLYQIDSAKGAESHKTRKSASLEVKELKLADTRALIRTVCTVSGAVGHRLVQDQIDRIIPIFLTFCDSGDAHAGDDDFHNSGNEEMYDKYEGEDDEAAILLANELRESCFAGFQSFILRCPRQIQSHLHSIIHSALSYMRFDPNYSYGDEQEDEDGNVLKENVSEEEHDDDEEFDDTDDYEDDVSDDDDGGEWKVRRSAIRVISSVVESFKHDLFKLWSEEYIWKKNRRKTTVAGALVDRFKEREENCRVDIINCFNRLLAISVAAASAGDIFLSSTNNMDTSANSSKVVVDLQSCIVPAVVKACVKQLEIKKSGINTKSSAVALLSTLCSAPGGIGGVDSINSVFHHLNFILCSESTSGCGSHGTSKSLKLDTLSLIKTIISCSQHDHTHVKDILINTVLKNICNSVEEHWHKIVAEALRVLEEIPQLLSHVESNKEELTNIASTLFNAIEPRLGAHDLDQEIKECSLAASASLLSILHESLTLDQKNQMLLLILERLKNESTLMATIKTLSIIASEKRKGSNKIDLSSILTESISKLSALLRQSSRVVKQRALKCLNVVISFHGSSSIVVMNEDFFRKILKEVGMTIVDSDLHISHLSLRVSISILQVCPSCSASMKEYLLPPALALSTSSLLQEIALDSLLAFLKQIVISGSIKFCDLLSALQCGIKNISERGTKQVIGNLAKCIAAITASGNHLEREQVVSDLLLLLEMEVGSQSTQKVQLALRVSGDLGCSVDLSKLDGVAERLQKIYVSYFNSESEHVKHAAAYGLGRASVGAMSKFLPLLLQSLEKESQKKQFLLLSALRELIHCHHQSKIDMSSSIHQILPHLVFHCANKEEGVRIMVAECIGSLICLQPDVTLPQLKRLVAENVVKLRSSEGELTQGDNKAASICWTVATSVKFAIAGHVDTSKLSPEMPSILVLLHQDDLVVKNAALLVVYSAVHHNPQLVANCMQKVILPSLYEVAKEKRERVIDMGPFKHRVDDSLPLRKTAISIFATCLEKCPAALDIQAFMPILMHALSDKQADKQYDIQLHAHQIVLSMCSNHPIPIVASIDSFVDPLQKALDRKILKKTGPEIERAQDFVKSAVRVTLALSNVDGTMNSGKFAEFVDVRKRTEAFKTILL